jgi:hypothetical protein
MKKLDKSLKVLWLINGVLIFLLVLFGLYNITKELFLNNEYGENNEIILGTRLEAAKEKGLALQGLSYTDPRSIYNSPYNFVTVSATTYDEAKAIKEAISAAGDISTDLYGISNMIFMDSQYKVIRTLVNEKADIRNWRFSRINYNLREDQVDTTVKNIAFEIAFEDTNADGILNHQDQHNLYISELTGENLTLVIDNVDLINFNFEKNNSQLFLSYFELSDVRQEHKRKKFAIYDIESGKLQLLSDLDKAITDLENQLVN